MKDVVAVEKAPEAPGGGLQASMSRSSNLIECSYAYGLSLEYGEASEAARYGSAFHELIAQVIANDARTPLPPLEGPTPKKIAARWGVSANHQELVEHVAAAHEVLKSWLHKNEFRIDFDAIRKKGLLLLEQAIALKPLVSGRRIPEHDAEHRYGGLEPGELPGTLDLAIFPHRRDRKKLPILVMDHKTGGSEDFSRPLDKPQLLSLTAGSLRLGESENAIVTVMHANRRGMPKVYGDTVKLSELRQYETRLQVGLSRIGDGSMRPGAWCKWCPARSVCPAQDAELLKRAGDVLTGLTAAGGALSSEGLTANDVALARVTPGSLSVERKLGHLYDVIRYGEAIAARGRAEIKKAILDSKGALLPETDAGEYLVVREYEKENLSKSGVLAAYGKIAGERMLTKLRKDGAISKTTVQQLWPEKERGR